MAEITAEAVRALRERTDLPMMECKKALVEAGGDQEKAVQILKERVKGLKLRVADRPTSDGKIPTLTAADGLAAVMIEVQCESAPVAKSELFVKLANDLARQIAVKGVRSAEELLTQPFIDTPGRTVNERISEVVGLMRENIKPARMARMEGILGEYVHHDGSVGVLLQVEGEKADAAH